MLSDNDHSVVFSWVKYHLCEMIFSGFEAIKMWPNAASIFAAYDSLISVGDV